MNMDFDPTKIKIPVNWVCVKVDADFDTYHNTETGQNTGIHVAPWGINQASHLAVTGTVMALPERLIYHGHQLAKMRADRKYYGYESKDTERQRNELYRESMSYDVPIEVQVGYKVYFEYTTRLNAFKEGRGFENEDGKFILIPYDLLVMAFRPTTDFNNVQVNDVYMLNGFVLVKPLEYATDKSLAGIKGAATESDIFIPVQPDAKYVKQGNVWYGNVLAAGCPVKHYRDFDTGGEGMEIGRAGQKISFDGRHKKRLEVEHHRVIFKKHELYRIHRKDIFMWFPDGNLNGMLKKE